MRTRIANSKQEMEAFSEEMRDRFAKGIIADKVPGVKFGDGEFWRKLASLIKVENAAYGPISNVKRNFFFEVAIDDGQMPRNRQWSGAAVWHIAFQKEYGGNLQKPKAPSKGIPIPTALRYGRASERNKNELRFVPARGSARVGGVIGFLIAKVDEEGLGRENESRASSGRGSLSMSTFRARQRPEFIVYSAYLHKARPDPWMPSESQLEGYRAAAVKKAFPARGVLRER